MAKRWRKLIWIFSDEKAHFGGRSSELFSRGTSKSCCFSIDHRELSRNVFRYARKCIVNNEGVSFSGKVFPLWKFRLIFYFCFQGELAFWNVQFFKMCVLWRKTRAGSIMVESRNRMILFKVGVVKNRSNPFHFYYFL